MNRTSDLAGHGISNLSQFLNSLRSKRFCGFSEQRKTEERDFGNFAAQEMGTSEKWSEGGGGKELWNKKWSRGEGGGGKGNACQQRSLF